jgi:serine phosphatase RsbU (regulator of sigma subunit)
MSLRARLTWAFFLLAVVPLSGVALYSYATTERAFRRAVEVEAAALADEMSGRLGSVTRDLGRRLEGLRQLPFPTLAEGQQPREAIDKLLADVRSHMGDAAPLVEALEFVPAPKPDPNLNPNPKPKPVAVPAPAAPAGARPPAKAAPPAMPPPPADAARGFVFTPETAPPPEGPAPPAAPDLPRWVFRYRELGPAAAESGADVEREARHAQQQIEREARRAEQQAEREAERVMDAQRRVERATERAARDAERNQRLAEAAKERQAQFEKLGEKLGEEIAQKAAQAAQLAMSGTAADKQAATQLATETAVQAIRHIGQAIVHGKMSFLADMGYRFDYKVERGGTDVGTMRARLRPQQVLASVFSRTRRRQGEIPFAVDEKGELYAADQDKARLQPLAVAAAVKGGRRGILKVKDDWVVVTRRDDESGLTLGIARPLGDGLKELRTAALKNLSYGLGMALLALVGMLPLSRRLTRDLQALTDGATKLAHGDLDARVQVRSRDEVGRLAEAFNRMAADLRSHQDQLLAQERMRKELEMGRRIQEEMLPHDRLRVPFAEAKGLSIPAREVGGDFFNYFPLDDGQAALLVGDVSGKGVAAALVMANLQATLRASLPLEKDLTALARHLDEAIDHSSSTAVYLTAFIGVLEGGRRVMRYVNAGHNPPLLLRKDGSVVALESTGRPLGLLPGGAYEERQVEFAEGDWLFLYTDGVTDSENEAGEPLGAERLQQILVAERDGGLDDVLARVERAVREHRGGREADDDATLVALRVGPSTG